MPGAAAARPAPLRFSVKIVAQSAVMPHYAARAPPWPAAEPPANHKHRHNRSIGIIRENVRVRAGDEAEDHVLVLQEPASDPAGVSRGDGLPVHAGGQPGQDRDANPSSQS
jgi:hypothetical protein